MKKQRFFAYRSFRPEPGTVKQFAQIGIDTVCFFPANTLSAFGVPYSNYPPIWRGLSTYDFSSLDKQIDDLREANPRVNLICMIDLNSPTWWVRLFGGRTGEHDSYYGLGKVTSSEKWRDDTRQYLEAFLNYTESRYSNAIEGYILACGATCEWQDQTHGEESNSRRVCWRRWMIDQGENDPVDIPPASVRDHISHDMLRDPVADALAIKYWRFVQWQNSDAILYFTRAAQKLVKHRVPVGSFYGYILEHDVKRLISEGHLDYDRLFAAPEMDFFIAPATYCDRQIGGASGFMTPLGSLQHHGKGFVQELDHRTHTANRAPAVDLGVAGDMIDVFWTDEASTLAGMKREFALALIEGVSLWWFDMWGRWYEGKNVIAALQQMKELWDRLTKYNDSSAAQVAMVVDAESMLYLDQNNERINEFIYNQRIHLGHIGAPYRIFSFADLADLDITPYKLLVFPNLFVVDQKKRDVLEKHVCRAGRTIVWVYRPGVISNGRYAPEHVEDLTGIPMNMQVVTTRQMRDWTSVLSPDPALSTVTLRQQALDAGVHIYCNADEPVYASSRLLAAHSSTGGRKKFMLPQKFRRITELFSNRIIADNASAFEDDLSGPSTVLYEMEL